MDEEEVEKSESCTIMSFVFLNSLSEEITSLSLIQEVFQEKSFIILIVCKFSMESLIIGHEIHKSNIVVQMLG